MSGNASGGDEDAGLQAAAFKALIERKQKASKSAPAARRAVEAKAHTAVDGRVSSTTNERGLVQLNVRVPLELKNRLIELRSRRNAGLKKGETKVDVAELVAEALRLLFEKGGGR